MTLDVGTALFVLAVLFMLAGVAIVVLPYWLALLVRGSTVLVRWRHD